MHQKGEAERRFSQYFLQSELVFARLPMALGVRNIHLAEF